MSRSRHVQVCSRATGSKSENHLIVSPLEGSGATWLSGQVDSVKSSSEGQGELCVSDESAEATGIGVVTAS
jgi:hypothetical protein